MITKNTSKAILAVWHVGDMGKTETLRHVANLLLQTFPQAELTFLDPSRFPESGDVRLVVKINGRIVAVESEGDPGTGLKGRLLEMADEHKADVIFCATRTRGDTVRAVDDVAKSRGYEVIWTSTYQTADNHDKVNALKAKHIIELMRELSFL